MFYNGYHFMGMHLLWWFVWLVMFYWIFATPYDLPGQRKMKDTPLDVLKKRFAAGQIGAQEYQETKRIINNN